MKSDGTDIIPISYHETNEWHPSVNNDGMLVCTRWDYLDRDDCIAHHMWICGPDGTDPRPPTPTLKTWQGERAGLATHQRATISIMNVTYGDLPLPTGTKITQLRIMQIIPKFTPGINDPQTGYASEGLTRLSLGTVPVESDGSVYCEAPVGKEIYFQLLDEKGLAVQSMRAGTFVHAGEQMTCYGCHEDKWKAAPVAPTVPLALRRPPSKLQPEPGSEPGGATPINYYRLAKPVFTAKCLGCHQQQNAGPRFDYASLQPYAFYFCREAGYLNGDIITPILGGSRTIPGKVGARVSKLLSHLGPGHHNVSLTSDEYRRITLWLDGNSMEFSAYTNLDAQRQGKFVWPELDVDSANPTGVESAFPPPGQSPVVMNIIERKDTPPALTIARKGRDIFISANGRIAVARIDDTQGRLVRRMAGTENRMIELDAGSLPRGAFIVRAYNSVGRCIGAANICLM